MPKPEERFDGALEDMWDDSDCLANSKRAERWSVFWNIFFLLAIISITFCLTVVLCKYWNNQMRLAGVLFRQGDYEAAFNVAGNIPKFYLL